MPYGDPDPTDPNVRVGVILPAEEGTQEEMAYTFAEEFLRLGYRPQVILRIFRSPFYAGAHAVYRKLGEDRIRAIIEECARAWGPLRFVDRTPRKEETDG